jgi:anion-transporting  ArsA/GET3 family ATPase
VDVRRFFSSRVLIVAGKGGVGKTTVTAAMAVTAARAGMSVLVVDVEGKSGLASCFGSGPLDYEEAELAPGIRARTLTPDAALQDWLENNGLRRISKRLVRSGALDVVATAVPGMKDILVLGKVKQLERAGIADLILVDAPAAGHAITFLLSARGLLDAVRVGPVRKQAIEVLELLADPDRCQVTLVTLPEETPVNELVDTAFAVEDRTGVALGPIVVNACYPARDLTDEPALIAKDAEMLDVFVADREAHDLVAAARFHEDRYALQRHQTDRLAARLPLPQLELPFSFGEIGPPELEDLADALDAEIAGFPEPPR